MPLTRTTQPDGPVGIDWSNPLARGLVLADNPLVGFNEVDGKYPYSMATRRVSAGSGVAYSCESAPSLVHDYTYSPAPSGDTTVLLLATPAAAEDTLLSHVSADGEAGIEIEISAGGQLGVYTATANDWFEILSGLPLSPGVEAPLVVAHNNTSNALTFYTRSGSATAAGDSGISGRGAVAFSSYISSGSLSGVNGSTITLALMWNRVLDAHEARAIIDNPWQIFAPIRPPVPKAAVAESTRYGTPGQWDKTLLIDGWFGEIADIKGWYAVDFLAPAAPPGGTTLKVWTGSAWVAKPLKRWNGSAWVAVTALKRWNGSAWV